MGETRREAGFLLAEREPHPPMIDIMWDRWSSIVKALSSLIKMISAWWPKRAPRRRGVRERYRSLTIGRMSWTSYDREDDRT